MRVAVSYAGREKTGRYNMKIIIQPQGTLAIYEQIINQLKEQGYQFVSIGQLIYRDGYHMAPDGTQIKNY